MSDVLSHADHTCELPNENYWSSLKQERWALYELYFFSFCFYNFAKFMNCMRIYTSVAKLILF